MFDAVHPRYGVNFPRRAPYALPRGHACWKWPIQDVVKAVVSEYPPLEDITPADQAKLVWAESNVMFDAVDQLLATSIVALPTHDSIVVKEDDIAVACSVLATRYEKEFGKRPTLRINRPKWNMVPSPDKQARWPQGPVSSIDDLIEEMMVEAVSVTKIPPASLQVNITRTEEATAINLSTSQTDFRNARGRPRKYVTSAERQRAYRERKKAEHSEKAEALRR